MSSRCAVIICLVLISYAAGRRFHTSRDFQTEQFQANQQFQGQQGVQWSRTQVTPNVVGIVQQGLGKVQYDATNIQIQQVRQRVIGNGLDFKVSFQNPVLHQNCIFQLSYCGTCSVAISPLTPACSSPCPGQVCRVDTSLRHLNNWFKSHRKSWQDRKYDEQDFEGHTINNSADVLGRNNGMLGMSYMNVGLPRMNTNMGMNQNMGMGQNMGMNRITGLTSNVGMNSNLGMNSKMGMSSNMGLNKYVNY